MVKKANRQRKVWKKIEAGLSMEERFHNFILDKVYRATLHGKKKEADIFSRATRFLFPRTANVLVADATFKALWKLKRYKDAIAAYLKVGRLFWYSEQVGRYYERRGQMSKAVVEYQYLLDAYFEMRKNFLPLPQGPRELFILGQWYAKKDKDRARQYLKLYLSAATVWGRDPAFCLRHKRAAEQILSTLG